MDNFTRALFQKARSLRFERRDDALMRLLEAIEPHLRYLTPESWAALLSIHDYLHSLADQPVNAEHYHAMLEELFRELCDQVMILSEVAQKNLEVAIEIHQRDCRKFYSTTGHPPLLILGVNLADRKEKGENDA